MKEKLVLEEGKHFTRGGLAKWMNENCPPKSSGKKYIARDVQGYAARGNMPESCGGYKLTEVKYKYFGVFVIVEFKD